MQNEGQGQEPAKVAPEPDAPLIAEAGALAFGLVVGWFLYHVNRQRKEEVKLTDVVSLIGAVGGAAVLALFPAKSQLFGAYGVGLALGFFLYFVVLLIMVGKSKNFDADWFLDGRRKDPATGVTIGDTRPMGVAVTDANTSTSTSVNTNTQEQRAPGERTGPIR